MDFIRSSSTFFFRKSAVFSLLFFYICVNQSFGQLFWGRFHNYNFDSYGTGIAATMDGNYLLTGYAYVGTDSCGIVLVKITRYGEELWAKVIDGNLSSDEFCTISPTPDGCYIIAGNTDTPVPFSLLLAKVDSDGNTLWIKKISENDTVRVYASTTCSDGSIVFTGHRNRSVYILKATSDGEKVWSKTMGDTTHFPAGITAAASSAGYILIGAHHRDFVSDVSDYCYILDMDGNCKKTIPINLLSAVYCLSDGNFIAGGLNYTAKIDTSGHFIWAVSHGDDILINRYYPSILQETPDGGMLTIGKKKWSNPIVIKLSPDGVVEWEKYIGLSWPKAFAAAPDGNFIVVGTLFDSLTSCISASLFINDRYAFSDSLFTMKLPVGKDSLDYRYEPGCMPPGMNVSAGGTITWMPSDGRSYLDSVRLYLDNDADSMEHLSFMIHIIAKENLGQKHFSHAPRVPFAERLCVAHCSPGEIRFTIPSGFAKVSIFNKLGNLIAIVPVTNKCAVWNGFCRSGRKASFGHYLATAGILRVPFFLIW